MGQVVPLRCLPDESRARQNGATEIVQATTDTESMHEFVLKLDMLNGRANGLPPMQPDMNPARLSRLMGNAFEDFFCRNIDTSQSPHDIKKRSKQR